MTFLFAFDCFKAVVRSVTLFELTGYFYVNNVEGIDAQTAAGYFIISHTAISIADCFFCGG